MATFCSINGAAARPLLRPWPHGGFMFTKLIGATTLFAAGSLLAGGSTSVGATAVEPFSGEAALSQAGSCGAQESKESKEEGKAPAKTKEGKAKDGSCGKGSCGSKDVKKGKAKDGSCGKGSCGSKDSKKDKKEGSCGKDKKEASCGADKK
jgi:uncharacterized low-complexity protein